MAQVSLHRQNKRVEEEQRKRKQKKKEKKDKARKKKEQLAEESELEFPEANPIYTVIQGGPNNKLPADNKNFVQAALLFNSNKSINEVPSQTTGQFAGTDGAA